MEQLEQLKVWVMSFPQWGDGELAVDSTGAKPGQSGLFPLGIQVLERREDVLGNRHDRLRQQFLLRRTGVRGMADAAWLLAFQQWAGQNAAEAPCFGGRQTLRAEGGRLVSAAQTGAGCYEVKLTFEYENEEI